MKKLGIVCCGTKSGDSGGSNGNSNNTKPIDEAKVVEIIKGLASVPIKNLKGEVVGFVFAKENKADTEDTKPIDTPIEEITGNKLVWKESNSDDELIINNSQENWLNEVFAWDIVDSDGNSVAFDKNGIDSNYKITFENIERGLSVIDVAVDYSESVSGSVAMFREKSGEQSKEFQPFFKRSISLSAQKTNDTFKAKLTIECLSDKVTNILTAIISKG